MTVQKILGSREHRTSQIIDLFHPKAPVLSTTSGKWFTAKTTRELLELILVETLIEPLRFDLVLDGCLSSVMAFNGSNCRVLPVGPTNAVHSVVAALKLSTNVSITVQSPSTWFSEKPARSIQDSGSFKNSKLAIVGMAGRFPGAADHEKFWGLLEQGLDVHRKVSLRLCRIPSFEGTMVSDNSANRYRKSALTQRPISILRARREIPPTHLSAVS